MPGHPLFWLAIVTFLLVLGAAGWSLASTMRLLKHGRPAEGLGGPNDPMA